VKSLFDLILDGLRVPTKQTKACETIFKQPQNGARLNPKPTPRSKKNKIKENHKKKRHLKKKNIINMGNETNRRMDTLDMP
jgi:hypothetical protein